ncbi:MAG TPA: DUF3175 domain-containing protein [Methyloceanibacter sp.]|jgi:hypothetical protein|nr:DUF3175 domain-containing protein [Methyloceanibacter sp.]
MAPRTRKATKSRKGTNGRKRWSQAVTTGSNALDLQKGVFTLKDPRKIALSLKRSAEQSTRRKSDPYRSAMSMLVFYINRAGKNLPQADRARLEKAKNELRKAFGKKAA